MRKLLLSLPILTLLAIAAPTPSDAQRPYTPERLAAEDYTRAEGFLGTAMNPLVYGTGVRPTWLEDGRFWYRVSVPEGYEFILVDPERRQRERASRTLRMLSRGNARFFAASRVSARHPY